MLKKLIKHEWVSVWRALIIINITLLLGTILGLISIQTPLWSSDIQIINIIAGTLSFIYILGIIVTAFAALIYLVVHFYKNLYTDEGYLMHTLPVKPIQLLISKLVVSTIWMIITSIVIYASIFLLIMTTFYKFTAKEGLNSLVLAIEHFFKEISIVIGIPIPLFIICIIIVFIITIMGNIIFIYSSITIGQLLKNHKVIGSFLAYIGIFITYRVINSFTISTAVEQIINNENTLNSYTYQFLVYPNYSGTIWFTMITTSVVIIVLSSLLMFVSNAIMKRKLNLD